MRTLLSSILWLGFIATLSVAAAFQSEENNYYRDPHGRFAVLVPSGWSSAALGDEGVRLSRANSYCNVTHIRGQASGQDLVSQVIGQITTQWKNFSVVDQGQGALAGSTGAFAVGVGTNPKGIPAVFRIIVVDTGTESLAVISSAPQTEFASRKEELSRIEQSLAFGGGKDAAVADAVPSAISEKLAALDTACRAGVFTSAECDKKKKELLSPAPASQTPPSSETATPARTAAGNAAPGGVTRFTRLSVKDPGVNNIEAVSFLIPAGWRAEGGIQWYPDYLIQASLLMKVSDPQTGATIEFLPLQNFTWQPQPLVPMRPGTNYLGSIVWSPIMDVPQFIQTFYGSSALRQLQKARLVTSQDLPNIAQSVGQINGVSNAKAARARYEYQINGQPWEEDVYAALIYNPYQLGMLWSVTNACSFRAPKGQLDQLTPIMNTTIQSMRLSLDWFSQYQYVQKLFVNRMMQGIRNAGALSDTVSRNGEEIRQMFSDSYRQSCESQDRISQSFTEYIRGVETYRNPYENRPVQLPSGYSNIWVNNSGEYILANQAGYNPNVGSNIEWRPVEKSQ